MTFAPSTRITVRETVASGCTSTSGATADEFDTDCTASARTR
ncbi:hypothetical protein [Bifidobacterium jacchi]|nr:hypothetical protein [Bifidobacterium jacchi]